MIVFNNNAGERNVRDKKMWPISVALSVDEGRVWKVRPRQRAGILGRSQFTDEVPPLRRNSRYAEIILGYIGVLKIVS